jgi:nucleotide-binding universal stress UspA family protein
MARAVGSAAVRWASAEAVMRGLPLRLVHAWDQPLDLSVDLGPESLPDLHAGATADAVYGPAAVVLLAREPELLVLGGHTGGRHLSHLTRSCLNRAACPVVIVPNTERPQTGRVLAAVHSGETSGNALRWAADEAQRRHAQLVVVHAWQVHPTSTRDLLQPTRAIPAQRDAAHDRLHAWVYSVLGNIDAELNTTHGGPLDALLHHSTDADLIVLGRGTHSGLGRMLHGTVGNDLSSLAPCPIALIPHQPPPGPG